MRLLPVEFVAIIRRQLRERVATSRVVNTDDTGWRINATMAFVMGFFTADTAYYQIRYHKGFLGTPARKESRSSL